MFKRLKLFLLLGFLTTVTSAFAGVQAFLDYKFFYIPNSGMVLETYLDFEGNSIQYRSVSDSLLQGEVEVTIFLRRDEDIVQYDKTVLKSPVISDSLFTDFLDLKRFPVEPGIYTLEIMLKDIVAPESTPVSFQQEIEIPAIPEGAFFSDIQRVSGYRKTVETNAFSKSGYDLLPYVSEFYNPELKQMVYYLELYHMDKEVAPDEKFLLSTVIKSSTTRQILPEFSTFQRKESASVIPILNTLDISQLKSGNYILVVEARNKDNELICEKEMFFRRYLPGSIKSLENLTAEKGDAGFAEKYKNRDSLNFYVQSLRPISENSERRILENNFSNPEKSDIDMMQSFLYSFWLEREGENAEEAWNNYLDQVMVVEKAFGTRNRNGFETDRGRVYLKYGPPNDITDRSNEPSSYPYQIWRYYKADQFNNVKFVFYDRDLVARDYELLDVDYIPGEIRNPRWKLILQSRNTPMNNVDRQQGSDHYGGRIDDLYENPR